MYMYYIYMSIYVYIYIYIYIYIYMYYMYSIPQDINFLCKSFQLCFYQLHIYNKIVLQLSNLQIVYRF